MATLTESAAFANDHAVRSPIMAAIAAAAVSILNEDPTSTVWDAIAAASDDAT